MNAGRGREGSLARKHTLLFAEAFQVVMTACGPAILPPSYDNPVIVVCF